MRINDKIKKTVAFLQYKLADGTYKYAGTCFFIQRNGKKENSQIPYVVTAKHVIEGVKKTGLASIFIKLNLTSGQTIAFETLIEDWLLHEDVNTDVAVFLLPYNPDLVDQYVTLETTFIDEEKIRNNEVDCGDEVIITGLFKHHTGGKQNLPIIRIGNIAMMPGEKVQTKDHLMDAYLIESRSIGGLSGSPVFINYGLTRRIKGQVLLNKDPNELVNNLIGLVYGHFDANIGEIDAIDGSSEENKKINVGIAIVTPISKLSELFESTYFRNYEERMLKKFKMIREKQS